MASGNLIHRLESKREALLQTRPDPKFNLWFWLISMISIGVSILIGFYLIIKL